MVLLSLKIFFGHGKGVIFNHEVKMKPFDGDEVPPGYKVIYCRYITRGGKRIYPKNKTFFRFVVKI